MKEYIITKQDSDEEVLKKLRNFALAKSYGTNEHVKGAYEGEMFLCELDNLIHTPLRDFPKVPRQFKTKNTELSSYIARYGCYYVQDLEEFTNGRGVCFALDTQLYYSVSVLTRTIEGEYYLDKSNLGELFNRGQKHYSRIENIVISKDTNRPIYKSYGIQFDDDYYEYEYSLPVYAGTGCWVFDITEPKSITERCFGIEFEFLNGRPLSEMLFKDINLRKIYSAVEDGSVRRLGGHEFVSVPLQLSEMEYVDKMIDLSIKSKAEVSNSCGTHIHISYDGYTWKDLVKLVNFCKENENEIFDYVMPHRHDNQYCRKLDSRFNFREDSMEDSVANFYSNSNTSYENRTYDSKWSAGAVRHYWLSLDRIWRYRDKPEYQTIEFRHLQCTQNAGFIKHFINFCWTLVEACQKGNPKKIIDIVPYSKFPEQLENFLINGKFYEEENH